MSAAVSAMSAPFDTAACVYALWFFLGDRWKEVYEPAAAATASGPQPTLNSVPHFDEARWSGIRQTPEGDIIAQPVQKPDWR
jgi:hypothetical protein